jgi:hypothetical protein
MCHHAALALCSAVVKCFGLLRLPAEEFPKLNLSFDTYGILLEYCEGGTLKDLLVSQYITRKDTYSVHEAMQWLVQVTGGRECGLGAGGPACHDGAACIG